MSFIINPYVFSAAAADSPDDISGLLVWFKADSSVFSDAGSTAANNGDTVQQWNDQSGNAVHASQATSGSRPTYRTNQVNGLPAVDFATSKWMSFTEQSFSNNFTIFAVVKQGSAATVKTVLGGTNNSTKLQLYFNSYNVKSQAQESDEEAPTSDFVQLCLRNETGVGATLRVDEVATGGVASALGATAVSHLGTRLNSGSATEFLNGSIAELIVYNAALSSTDRAVVEAYLRVKYALPNPAQALTDPTTITGCKLWLRASTLVLSNGDPVATWSDASGLGNDATQATSGSRPTYQTGVLNSLPVVRFDGSNDWLQVPSFTIGALAVVHKYRTGTTYPDYKTPFNDRTPADGRVMLFESGTSTLRGSSVMTNRMFRNGTKTNSSATITSFQIAFGSWPGNTLTDAYDVGRDDQNNARCWDGDIAEIIAFDRGLSPANRVRIQNYLNGEYAIF